VVGDGESQAAEFHAALQRMQDQAVAQRRAVLTSKSRSGALDAAEKTELRQLLAARAQPPSAPA
jgi:DNA primase